MNNSIYRFTLDTQSNISQVSLPVRLLDTGRRLYISLTDGGNPYTIKNGCRAVFYARKADGNPLMNDCIIEQNTQIRYDLTAQTTSCAGVVDCEIRLYGIDGKLITSPRFIIVVDSRVVYDEDFPLSDSEKSALDNIVITENARVNAESERVAAEEERAIAEKERQATNEEMLDVIQKASSIADTLEKKLANGDYNGEDGLTPYIGDNGNWWIGGEDTGVKAEASVDISGVQHTHNAADITSGTLPITRGGTGGTTAMTARSNLGVYSTTVVDGKLAEKAPAYSYGTSDMTANSSALTTGKLHFVYE